MYYILKEDNLRADDYEVKDRRKGNAVTEARVTYIDRCNYAVHIELYDKLITAQTSADRLLPDPSVQPMLLFIYYQKRKRYRLDEAEQAQDLVAGVPSRYTNKVIVRVRPYEPNRQADKLIPKVALKRRIITDSIVSTTRSNVTLDTFTLPLYDPVRKDEQTPQTRYFEWLTYSVVPVGNVLLPLPQHTVIAS